MHFIHECLTDLIPVHAVIASCDCLAGN